MPAIEKKRVPIERIRGRGKVYRSDQYIAEVDCEIKVVQEMHIARTFGKQESVPGLKEITGVVRVVSGETDLVDGSLLTLRLSDGRVWTFYARSEPVAGTFDCVNASGEGLTRPPAPSA